MKKLMVAVVAVAVAFAFSMAAMAQQATTTTKTAKDTTTTTVKEKAPGQKEVVTTTKTGEDVTVKDVTKNKEGKVYEDTVMFHKYDQNGDYIYVMKDNKEIRLKHKLSDSDKKIMLQKKNGDTVKVTSTYPLTQSDLAVITTLK